ncbi:sulfurtransferase [Salisediminibacterium halotolerans]|uniref:sulfurtransferase n=1 Tax=Salisediminibacterium halotolerans TaxID=517425 RepID=UPI000EADEB7E|nr:sulfurtransferase [Salisediminibacterium halotolerans]RLJ73120.1 thiosulfate/3-mercaptopyruvate sulfurtransferase [Actinophytocola xinjiangensis]RPE86542.1 thiosulfate/3-mercaptopyruvate sulfurtransferase [Salisediminibacterium halotolerans]TWG33917.1 thiosulfate/3-mercaptopyruvate sulfurtransferase [Salisediminibacterium halotolerans]GEL08684.1 sulfurtransferase [Salisediminibacterium halotolerans]
MKRMNRTALTLIAGAMVLTACGNDDDTEAGADENGNADVNLSNNEENEADTDTEDDSNESAAPAQPSDYPNEDLLVDTDWVEEHIDDDDVQFVDMRDEGFEGGHIPGAVNTTWQDLNDMDHGVDGMILDADEYAEKIEELGISDDTTVVAYDDGTGTGPARLFYGLEYYGHDDVRILNGGFQAWNAEGRDIDSGEADVETGEFEAEAREETTVDLDYTEESIDDENSVLLDVRSDKEFSGEDVRTDRGGHIPTAVNLPWTEALHDGEIEYLKAPDELEELYAAEGITADEEEIIVYCQTNVRAVHTYFTLRLLGFDNIVAYEGSWSEWGNDPDVPIDNPSEDNE